MKLAIAGCDRQRPRRACSPERLSGTEKIFPTHRWGRLFRFADPGYGLGDDSVVVVVELLLPGAVFIVVFDSVFELAGVDLSITVVLFSVFFSAGGFVTVVSFCSQAARKAMLINRQMYFMISS
jgi:hypothetical protein